MSDLDAQFKQAVSEYKSGNKDKARDLLTQIVDQDQHHEQAWLYLSALVGTLEEQQRCLENVLAINPANLRARKGLDKVTEQIAARSPGFVSPPPVAPAESSPLPVVSPFFTLDWGSIPDPLDPDDRDDARVSGPIGAEFEAVPGDALVSNWSASRGLSAFEVFDVPDGDTSWPGENSALGWQDAGASDVASADRLSASAGDPFAVTSGMGWGRDGEAAVYGSEPSIDLPSEQEYDSWVQRLNMGVEDEMPTLPETPMPDEDASSLFGDSDHAFNNQALSDQSGWDRGDQQGFTGIAFGSVDTPEAADQRLDDGAQRDDSPSFGGDFASEDESGSHVLDDDESELRALDVDEYDAGDIYDGDDNLDDLVFSFDDDILSDQDGQREPESSKRLASDESARYFAQIPADIEAKARGSRRGLLVLGILVMAALNAASFIVFLYG